jgi:hypothetical protein
MRDIVPVRPSRPDGPTTPSGPLTGPSVRALRDQQVGGLTRRTLLRAAIGTGLGLWAWMIALIGSMSAVMDGPTLAATQTAAMIATVAIGLTLIHVGDAGIGTLVVLAGVTMLIPWAWIWLAFGAEWTAIGLVLAIERPRRVGLERGLA